MTHEQACREAAAFYQGLAADRHEQYRCSVDEGDNLVTTDLIDWNLERAAEVACKAGFLERILGSALHYEDDQEVAESRYMAGMHIASANALTDKRVQIRPDDAIVKAEGGAA